VRLLRKAIPTVIALILGATLLFAWIDPLRVLVKLPADAGKMVISGTKITMQSPKLNGYTRDQRWYEMTAEAAAQDITKPDLIELRKVDGKIQSQDKSTIFLSADDGLFNRKANVLTLNRNIVLRSSGSYEMHLEQAVVDTTSGEVVSDKPVKVFTDQGTVVADRLQVIKSGEVVNFIGNVVMNLNARNDAGVPPKDSK
jgi:lipopolysaccharide export system protein LptC